jgi:hypothetical protein
MVFASRVKTLLSQHVSDDMRAQMAYQSIKKGLPDSCSCMRDGLLEKLKETLTRPPCSLSSGYLDHVRGIAERLFPVGWDANYESHARAFSPPVKASADCSRGDGGAFASFGKLEIAQHDALEALLRTPQPLLPPYSENGSLEPEPLFPAVVIAEAKVVSSAGKPRPLTVFPAVSSLLRPLHETLYDRVSSKWWCLKGPPTKDALKKAGFRGSQTLVSGDYRSATDNLPIEVAEEILKVSRANSTFIPPEIFSFALRQLRPVVQVYTDEPRCIRRLVDEYTISTGQLMGSLTSFPLLCIQNYAACTWALRTWRSESGDRCRKWWKIPILINGDDVLMGLDYQNRRDLMSMDHWVKCVGSVGLSVEESKTDISEFYGTINSTLLIWQEGLLVVDETFRFGRLRDPEDPSALGTTYMSWLKAAKTPKQRFDAAFIFFKTHIGLFRRMEVCLSSLGFRGRLALRMTRIFGLADHLPAKVPSIPCQHNVQIPNDVTIRIPKSEVPESVKELSGLEMVAKKWELGFRPAERESDAIQYALDFHNSVNRPDRSPPFWSMYECELLFNMRLYTDEDDEDFIAETLSGPFPRGYYEVWYRHHRSPDRDGLSRTERFMQAPKPGDALLMYEVYLCWENRLPSYEDVASEMVACGLVDKQQEKDTKLACLDPKIVRESKRNWAT